ncbi:HPr kinase/phosphorylase [Agrobacterium larrymoorei]|uniref:HPr kinase/phosphorylase n=1 Tax=Agrobacterium larrymoorei TaxID=160699 RepID=UPI0015717705|nr:HPr kinase/phosphorylase [Agrobacterium larrymoorei]NTJ43508.1 HPr kinase/phosphorylase [Agrobacterium larrymoorei]
MSADRVNFHGTAIIIGETGLLFVGPSGSGKSELAFSFLTEGERCGLRSALIADDQVFISLLDEKILAERPDSISGMIELRGSGIVSMKSVPSAILHYAITPTLHASSPRLPPDEEWLELPFGQRLPLIRIPLSSITPYGKFAALAKNLFRAKEM